MSAFAARQQLWGMAAAARPKGGSASESGPEEDELESKRTGNFQKKVGGRLMLTTREGERLVILGSFGVKVREGEATIAGAVLTPADPVQWVHAPHCHAVPVLRTADDTVLELQPHPAARELRHLATLNPVFAKLWNETIPGRTSKAQSSATFQIIYNSQDVPKRGLLQELTSPAEWNKKLSGLATAKRKGTPVIFLCGPKSSGKSTFGRLLTNRFITDRGGVKHKPWSSVMVLDIDPGQPEYSPPGVISLVRIATPNLSPSFCHPILTPAEGQLRAHAIASVTPALDPAHFIECVLDLFAHYQRSSDVSSPLVVNTPGWIQGTGLDILSELIASIRPTEVIYMSQDGPEETVNNLQAACATTSPSTPFSTLPSQPSEASSRTSLHFRTMQTMSYFHLKRQPSSRRDEQRQHGQQPQPYPTWDPTPLTDFRPWRVRYAGRKRGILGILCYDHQPAPTLLAEAINGTVLALVRLESRDALRDLDCHLTSFPKNGDNDDDEKHTPYSTTNKTKASKKGGTGGDESTLPLIPNPHSRTLSPRHSRLLALVLLRGVDTARRELQLLTPLTIEDVVLCGGEEEQDLVLVAGRFDTPTWAYSEWLCRSRTKKGAGVGVSEAEGEGEVESGGESDSDDADYGEKDAQEEAGDGGDTQGTEVPWVETLHGSQRRAVGSKVWRVRRDLGRN
ncbi:hypothetical protein C7999DRAFT_12132 [Corynascus novoguineensis]|uniref:Polynucleotide 5'-hydroxyl-kinase GRC3 n=1 Tax=Corynascus novoguineensis TaxID=1126955 RepID=A0AAN7CZV6_9PEZI|nr:hypothetical protein C7999DRAFT_12132 [Corynascus novoguineensis]